MNNEPLNIKTLKTPELEDLFSQMSFQFKIMERNINVIFTEIINRKQLEDEEKNAPVAAPLILPKLKKITSSAIIPNAYCGSEHAEVVGKY